MPYGDNLPLEMTCLWTWPTSGDIFGDDLPVEMSCRVAPQASRSGLRSEMGEAVMMFPPRACTTTHGLHNYTQPVQPHTACTTTHSLYNHTQPVQPHSACKTTHSYSSGSNKSWGGGRGTVAERQTDTLTDRDRAHDHTHNSVLIKKTIVVLNMEK